MKRESKIKSGFTLLETVISLMIIAIVSVGVYNTYLISIRNTKSGEVRQEATLIGKKVVEEIKSEQKQSDGNIYFDNRGNKLSDLNENSPQISYKVKIDKTLVNVGEHNVSINNGNKENRLFIEQEMLSDISEDKSATIRIDVNEFGQVKMKYSDNEKNIGFKELNTISLDFIHVKDNSYVNERVETIKIKINNQFNKAIKLYIWNSKINDDNNSNVKIVNESNSDIEGYSEVDYCYRNDNDIEGRSGSLYKINILVYGRNERGAFEKCFNTDIFQNID